MPRLLRPLLPSFASLTPKLESSRQRLRAARGDTVEPMADVERDAAALELLALRELEDQRAGAMQTELRRLLLRHPDARAVLKHLAIVESSLRKNGDRAFGSLPVNLLRAALGQLERLVKDWSPRGLTELRARLAQVIAERGAQAEAQAQTERVRATLPLPVLAMPAAEPTLLAEPVPPGAAIPTIASVPATLPSPLPEAMATPASVAVPSVGQGAAPRAAPHAAPKAVRSGFIEFDEPAVFEVSLDDFLRAEAEAAAPGVKPA